MRFTCNAAGVLQLQLWTKIPWLAHGFTTRQTGNFERVHQLGFLGAALGIDGMQLRTARQVHSDKVFIYKRETEAEADRPKADALVTGVPGALVAVRTADCVPIVLIDAGKRVVAVVHAGWRGSAKGITKRAVERMCDEFGCRPADLVAAIGPGIQRCCFEVSAEVADQFDEQHVSFQQKPHVDLEGANRAQLIEGGLPPQSIYSAQQCTYCDAQQFFSYRREGENAGRMLGFVGIRSG